MLQRTIYMLAALLTAVGCKQAQPEAAPSPQAQALAARMVGKVHPADGYAYALPYRLFVPKGYDATKKYPLILFLHGSGGWGSDNVRHLDTDVAELVSDRVQSLEPTFVLVPHCPRGDQWVNGAKSAPFMNYKQSNVPESDAAKLVLKVLAQTQREYGIDASRIYITGPSMGGSGTWDYITRYPGTFAAAVPVNGINDPSRAAVIAKLPIWAFHGALDDVSPVSNTRAMVEALRKLGSAVQYTELSDQGHMCDAAAYQNGDVWKWLLAQRKPAASL